MMRATSRYALKSLAILAERGDRRPTLSGEIPKGEAIPKKFLEAILRELKQHGIPSAQRGRGGGYALRRKPEEITLAAVIRVLDSPIAPLPCLSRTAYQPCEECKS